MKLKKYFLILLSLLYASEYKTDVGVKEIGSESKKEQNDSNQKTYVIVKGAFHQA